MAKAPTKDDADEVAAGKVRSARGLLVAAVVLSVISLGGGFFFARMAYMSDAAEFEPDFVEPEETAKEADEDKAASKDDTAHKDDGNSEKSAKEDGEDTVIEGLLEFEDIMTDITSYDADAPQKRAFLKLSVVLVYRPDPGGKELVQERQPFMRDLFTTYARSLTEPEVRGAAGLLTIKSELLKRARAATGNSIPQDVLIKDLIVQ